MAADGSGETEDSSFDDLVLLRMQSNTVSAKGDTGGEIGDQGCSMVSNKSGRNEKHTSEGVAQTTKETLFPLPIGSGLSIHFGSSRGLAHVCLV